MNFKKFFDAVGWIFFPKRCKYCGCVIEPDRALCSNCSNNLPEISDPVCGFCGHSKADCICKSRKSYYSSVFAPFYYENMIKTAVGRMKFRENPALCRDFAEDMYKVFLQKYADIDFDLICYVPFSPDKIKSRAFNQAELLAKHLSEKTGIKLSDSLCCLYNIKSQHRIDGADRKGNVFGAYGVVNGEEVKDKTVLLVDDIKTTGATLDECAKMLRLYGAEKVYAITFAVAKAQKNTTIDS